MLRNPTPSMFAAHVRKIVTPVGTGNLIAAVLLAICVGPGSAFAQSSGRPTTPPAPDQSSSTGSNPGVGLGPQVGPEKRFPTISTSPDEISKTFRPASMTGPHKVQVVVMLSADSVATSRAKMGGIKTSATHNDAIRQQALAQQTAIMPLLAAQGAKVLAQFQHALNGIKVEVDSSKIATLRSLPGVVNVLPVGTYDRNNAVSVPFIGAPLVWQGIPGFRGEGIKIAVIDTGIDYTHANFGGPGTVAAFNAAAATSTAPANPALFGPGAPKVKGGTDLVGDDYWPNQTVNGAPNPNYQPIPHPDPNPLDCAFALGGGHGSHTAGTAAGLGVLNNATYTGAYNSAAYSQHFQIGPGVAPKADIYSFRVFGCNGSTDVVTEAIDLAVAANVDVISMSLGAPWGDPNSSDAVASQNAALAGITVVAASGNAWSRALHHLVAGRQRVCNYRRRDGWNGGISRRQHRAQHGLDCSGDQRQQRAATGRGDSHRHAAQSGRVGFAWLQRGRVSQCAGGRKDRRNPARQSALASIARRSARGTARPRWS